MNRTLAMQLLGIQTADFTEADLRKAYRAAAKKNHPDVGGSEQLMSQINDAYNFLLNPANNKTQRMTVTHSGILDVVIC